MTAEQCEGNALSEVGDVPCAMFRSRQRCRQPPQFTPLGFRRSPAWARKAT